MSNAELPIDPPSSHENVDRMDNVNWFSDQRTLRQKLRDRDYLGFRGWCDFELGWLIRNRGDCGLSEYETDTLIGFLDLATERCQRGGGLNTISAESGLALGPIIGAIENYAQGLAEVC